MGKNEEGNFTNWDLQSACTPTIAVKQMFMQDDDDAMHKS